MRSLFLSLVAFGLLAAVVVAAEPTFPLQVSANRRHLADARGTPFLYHADTPWMLFFKLTEAEAKDYITHRRRQGFNTLQVLHAFEPPNEGDWVLVLEGTDP